MTVRVNEQWPPLTTYDELPAATLETMLTTLGPVATPTGAAPLCKRDLGLGRLLYSP